MDIALALALRQKTAAYTAVISSRYKLESSATTVLTDALNAARLFNKSQLLLSVVIDNAKVIKEQSEFFAQLIRSMATDNEKIEIKITELQEFWFRLDINVV